MKSLHTFRTDTTVNMLQCCALSFVMQLHLLDDQSKCTLRSCFNTNYLSSDKFKFEHSSCVSKQTCLSTSGDFALLYSSQLTLIEFLTAFSRLSRTDHFISHLLTFETKWWWNAKSQRVKI